MVIRLFYHGINLVRHHFRDLGIARKRSPHWKTVERHFLVEHPNCAACGTKTRPQIHHLKPFHLYPELELDLSNLLTLCMSKRECHLWLGHSGDWRSFNPKVIEHAAMIRNGSRSFEEVKALAIAAKTN